MTSPHLVILAHNIRSLWNIGSLFRTADAFAVSHLYLGGYSPTPPRREITKTALGADAWLPWSKVDSVACVEGLLHAGYDVLSLEITSGSIPLEEWKCDRSTCLIVGNEIDGVPENLLSLSTETLHIPMHGKKHSLNVSVAAGIALHHLRSHLEAR